MTLTQTTPFKTILEHTSRSFFTGIATDHQKVTKGCVFVAIQGIRFDSHTVLEQVCRQEPAAIVVQDHTAVPANYCGLVTEVTNSRCALAILAAHFFGNPSKELFCAGVTGTNGKTSLTYLIECLLSPVPTGVIGTTNHHLGKNVWNTEHTTPDPVVLHSRLREMIRLGTKALAIEVSSQAIHQYRVEGMHFDAAIFTNLSQDHLDYHGTFENYFAEKQKLFTDLLEKSQKPNLLAIINADDNWGKKLKVAERAKTVYYGQGSNPKTEFSFTITQRTVLHTHFTLKTPQGSQNYSLPMIGDHNVYNAVAALTLAILYGVEQGHLKNLLADFKGIPGRLQRVDNNKQLNIYVDYAHTPDGLENVLHSLKKVGKHRILTLFGCGGDRDSGKRPLMAQIAEKFSDWIIVTSDNPRNEDPEKIIDDIFTGFSKASDQLKVPIEREIDRAKAISKIIAQATSDDLVLIAGKGHEDYQILSTGKIYFSDVEQVQKNLL